MTARGAMNETGRSQPAADRAQDRVHRRLQLGRTHPAQRTLHHQGRQSVVGVLLAGRIGTRAVVTTGLLLLGTSFGWIALSPTFMSYGVVVGQMVLMGLGLGLTSAPATESILSVLPAAKAGVGSAVNDATREAGGTLGVAVLGSIFTSLYADRIGAGAFGALPAAVTGSAQESVAGALTAAAGDPELLAALQDAFMSGFHLACAVAAVVCWLGAAGALALPGRPHRAAVPLAATPA